MRHPRITAVSPPRAVEGGRIAVYLEDFALDPSSLREVRLAGQKARVVFASAERIEVLVPGGIAETGRLLVRVNGVPGDDAFVEVGLSFADELHQIDNPVFDREGNLYVTYSG